MKATARMAGLSRTCEVANFNTLEVVMWSKPEYTEMRFGFEVTMYIANRCDPQRVGGPPLGRPGFFEGVARDPGLRLTLE